MAMTHIASWPFIDLAIAYVAQSSICDFSVYTGYIHADTQLLNYHYTSVYR